MGGNDVTIKDVAKLAKVAPSTVSHFLNGKVAVSDETAEKVRKAIAMLGYQPNINARSLRSNKTQTIGLLVPNICNPFFAEIAKTINDVCHHLDYQMLLCDSDEDETREVTQFYNLLARQVDGLLIIRAGVNNDFFHLTRKGVSPVVFVDRHVDGRHSVTTDNYKGGRMAARHLAKLGHRQIGVVIGNSYINNVQERIKGFYDELDEHGIHVARDYELHGTQSIETGRLAQAFLDLNPRPTAIFATNDVIALGVWQKFLELGVRIPDDVSLVGYDNIEVSGLTQPSLTTVSQDKHQLGERSMELLINCIQGKVDSVTRLRIEPRLIVRGSTRAI